MVLAPLQYRIHPIVHPVRMPQPMLRCVHSNDEAHHQRPGCCGMQGICQLTKLNFTIQWVAQTKRTVDTNCGLCMLTVLVLRSRQCMDPGHR